MRGGIEWREGTGGRGDGSDWGCAGRGAVGSCTSERGNCSGRVDSCTIGILDTCGDGVCICFC